MPNEKTDRGSDTARSDHYPVNSSGANEPTVGTDRDDRIIGSRKDGAVKGIVAGRRGAG